MEPRELASAYWAYKRTKDEDLAWAWDAVDAEGWGNPEHKWPLILALLEAAQTDFEIGLVGAGPLEDLLKMFGRDFIDRIEAEARTNERLVQALAGAWLRGNLRPSSDLIADRVDRITRDTRAR